MADKMVKSKVALIVITLSVITHFLILFIPIYCEYENKSYVAQYKLACQLLVIVFNITILLIKK